VGKPVAAALNDALVPAHTVWFVGCVVIVTASFTVSVKLCEAVPAVLVAVNVMGYAAPLPVGGVPESVADGLSNVSQLGRVFVVWIVGVGLPVAVTVKLPGVPTVNVVPFSLVIVGAVFVPPPPPLVLKFTSSQ
jgi:hypothetical protein